MGRKEKGWLGGERAGARQGGGQRGVAGSGSVLREGSGGGGEGGEGERV